MAFPDRMRSRILCLAAIVALAVYCGGGGGGDGGPTDPPDPAPSAITITTPSAPPPRFIPVNASLAVGGTVTWVNGSPVNHDLLATTSNWHLSRTLAPAETFQTTVAQAGTYRYRCTIHERMNGVVEVR